MSTFIENEKKWLKSVVIPHILKNGSFIESIPKDTNLDSFRVIEIEINLIDTTEAFMLTTCYRASVYFEFNNQRNKRLLVVKKTPEVPAELFDEINFGPLFNNEIYTYSKIIPAIEKFTQQPFEVPQYFYSELQERSASIVLEDFGSKGWRVTKDRYNLSLDHVLSAVKYLGDFHGIGFAMREVKRKEFDDIVSNLQESRYNNNVNEQFNVTLKNSVQRLVKTSHDYSPDVPDEFLEKLQQLLSDGHLYGKQRVMSREPFVTLCHGDFLRNNIAYRYNTKDGIEVPIDVMMFDLQSMRPCSPMVDLVILLMLSAFAEVRYKNFELIFDTYRQQLIKSYETYAKKPAPSFFSHDSLMKEYVRFMPFGTHTASFFLMNIVDPPDMSSGDFLTNPLTIEEQIDDLMKRGGPVVDRELSHQVKEMYDFSLKYSVDIAEGIDLLQYSS